MFGYYLMLLALIASCAVQAEGQDRISGIRSLQETYLASAVLVQTVPAGKIGTGYLSVLSSAPAYRAFISNRHVFEGSTSLRLSVPVLDTLTGMIVNRLQLTIELFGPSGESLFVTPNDSSDLALALVSNRLFKVSGTQQTRGWGQSANIDSKDLFPGQEVVFVGYPTGRMVNGLDPLMRSGIIAGVDSLLHVIYLDADAFGGSSGSPVFLDLTSDDNLAFIKDNEYNKYLVSVISSYLPSRKYMKNAKTGVKEIIQTENSGIAVVVPSDRIWELAKEAGSRLKSRLR